MKTSEAIAIKEFAEIAKIIIKETRHCFTYYIIKNYIISMAGAAISEPHAMGFHRDGVIFTKHLVDVKDHQLVAYIEQKLKEIWRNKQ